MRTRRPFPDVEERDPEELGAVVVDPVSFSEFFPEHEADTAVSDNTFTPGEPENRRKRRAAVASWQPPEPTEDGEKLPTRRELVKQRQRGRLGKMDPALRRLQRKVISERARKHG
jgi:hypothetical protein